MTGEVRRQRSARRRNLPRPVAEWLPVQAVDRLKPASRRLFSVIRRKLNRGGNDVA